MVAMEDDAAIGTVVTYVARDGEAEAEAEESTGASRVSRLRQGGWGIPTDTSIKSIVCWRRNAAAWITDGRSGGPS